MKRFFKTTLYLSLTIITLFSTAGCGRRKTAQSTVNSEDLSQEIIAGIAEGFKNGDIAVTDREKKMLNNL